MTATSMEIRRRDLLVGTSIIALPILWQPEARAASTRGHFPFGRGHAFDDGWRFHRGEGSFEAVGLDDSGWRRVDLPHDWSIEDHGQPTSQNRFGPFDKAAVGGTGTGFTIGGEGWYRKRIAARAFPSSARVQIVFGAIAVVSDVWVNGQLVETHANAYTPFAIDLTEHIHADRETVIAVRARNIGRNSRWYVGSGIYRSVSLDVVPANASFVRAGVFATTRRISAGSAQIDVSIGVAGDVGGMTVRTVLKDARGRPAAEAQTSAGPEVQQVLSVPNARLWSPERPQLYTLETTLVARGKTVDCIVQSFGIRIITIDAERGLQINGVATKLRGGCVHHDNGLLGAAAYPDADDRRVRLLKERGFNAIRSSHNPASESFLDACDRHGMLLIEEAFDTWHIHKRPEDHATYFKDTWKEDLAAMVQGARNHPSVIMWSIGNEVPERSTEEGLEWSWRLANEVRRLDPTRPVTAGLQEFLGRPIRASEGTARRGHAGELDQPSTVFLDVAGYNYKLGDIEADHRTYPGRVIYASETYPRDAFDYARMAEGAPYFLGEFVWTSMDYIGEAGVGLTVRVPEKAPPFGLVGFPVFNAYCGDVDLIGDQKPQSLYRDVVWGLSPLEMLVMRPVPAGEVERIPLWGWSDELASWTWPGSEGKPLAVRLYTSADRIVLRLDGEQIGDRAVSAVDKMKIEFMVPYRAGTLEAVAYRSGKEIGRKVLTTVATATSLRLRAEDHLASGHGQLQFVHIDVVDAQGRLVPDAALDVQLNVNGPAQLVGFGSASPNAIGSLQSTTARTFHGRSMAILRNSARSGMVRVEARSEGLRGASAVIKLR